MFKSVKIFAAVLNTSKDGTPMTNKSKFTRCFWYGFKDDWQFPVSTFQNFLKILK